MPKTQPISERESTWIIQSDPGSPSVSANRSPSAQYASQSDCDSPVCTSNEDLLCWFQLRCFPGAVPAGGGRIARVERGGGAELWGVRAMGDFLKATHVLPYNI